jgi:hypothetical protein
METTDLPPIIDVVVNDNGIGFDEKNWMSFNEADSVYKRQRGGKGNGRFSYLVVFDRVIVSSRYVEGEIEKERAFCFSADGDGIEAQQNAEGRTDRGTTLRLNGLKEDYHPKRPMTLEQLAVRLVRHFHNSFAVGRAPAVVVLDEWTGERRNLNEVFQNSCKVLAPATLDVGTVRLDVRPVYVEASAANRHEVALCANDRVVETRRLGDIPHLNGAMPDEHWPGGRFLHIYVSSDYFDSLLDANRSHLYLPEDVDLHGFSSGAFEKELREFVETHLADFIKTASENSLDTFARFAEENPQYRHIVQRKRDTLARLTPARTPKELDMQMYRVLRDYDVELRDTLAEMQESLAESVEGESDEVETKIESVLSAVTENSRSSLAGYVAKRSVIIGLLEQALGRDEAGRNVSESRVHQLLCPMRRTGDEIDFDEHNLWLLDDSLAFYSWLSSDLQSFTDGSKKRPDLLVFGPQVYGSPRSITLVELKAPERSAYNSSGENPFIQVVEYAERIRGGKVRDRSNKPMKYDRGVQIYAYILADLTDGLVRQIDLTAGYLQKTADGEGYVGRHQNGELNLVVEVVPFAKLHRMARARNYVFQEKLGIPSIGNHLK